MSLKFGAYLVAIVAASLAGGLAITSAYQRPEIGGVVLLAVIFHKMPDAFALSTLLLLDRWSPSAIASWMAVFAITTPLGALLSWVFLKQANSQVVAGAIAL